MWVASGWPGRVRTSHNAVARSSRVKSPNSGEELFLAYPRNANDASQSALGQRLGTVNWDDNGVRKPRLYQHMMTTFDPIQSKPESLQRSNSLFARDRRVGGHQAISRMRLSSVSFGAASGILFRCAIMDFM